jgi:hypothetical protein
VIIIVTWRGEALGDRLASGVVPTRDVQRHPGDLLGSRITLGSEESDEHACVDVRKVQPMPASRLTAYPDGIQPGRVDQQSFTPSR